MILKRLILHGFKSFADRTEFEFDRGITGIVGPNGCGKSNLVDAIKWVLGSQSAKSLRGNQMLDVIFNGSGTRRSSGLAQVDLVFDNADGRLPMDHSEITVTRRLYRSGESEYLLNKQPCRLKDIRELFLDTGIGVDAYSVIEQGRVDSLLRANPADRRMIFEEAAGISKYKVRKREAQRRLERVNQNLLRLQDIINELERRLRSIKLQAGKARNYQSYTQRLRELRSTYALAEYHRLRESLAELERVVKELSDQSTRLRTEMAEHEAGSSRAQVAIADLEQRITGLDGRLLTVQSQITAHEERIAAAEQRIVEQTDLLGRLHERRAGIDEQLATLRARLDEQQSRAAQVEADLAATHEQVSILQARDHEAAAEQTAAAARLEDEKAGIIELLRRTSQLHNEIQGLTIQSENLTGQKSRLEARDAEIAAQLAGLLTRQQELESRRDQIDRLIADETAKLDETKTRAAGVAEHRTRLLEQTAAAKEFRSGLESRRQVLTELDRRREGLLAGARDILSRRDADPQGRTFACVRGPVGELFEADVAHAPIVEAVLGEHEQYLVVTQRDALLADCGAAATLEGRVLAFALDQVPPVIGGPDLRDQPGVVAAVLDWVRYPDDCERLARYLLGRTYVVESIDDATRLAGMSAGARFVTLDGVLFETDGRIAIGPLGAGGGLISRRSELRELAVQIKDIGRRISELTDRLAQTDTEAAHLGEVQQSLRTAIYEASTERVETQAVLAGVTEEARRLSSEQPLIAQEASALARQIQEARQREEDSRKALGRLEEDNTGRERAIAELQSQIEALTARRRVLTEEITQARVRAGELVQRRAALAETVRGLHEGLSQLNAERASVEGDLAQAQGRIEQSQRQVAEGRAALTQLGRDRETLTAEAAAAREQREALRREIDERSAELRRLRQQLDETDTRFHGEEVRLHEVRVRIEDLIARVRDEMMVDLEALYVGYQHAEQDWAAVEAEIAELKDRIERLGNVNLDAIAEQEELEKRHAFLTSQRDDLRESERQLTELIEKLNAESIDRFMKTFGETCEHFSALFKKLFGGGKAEIFLQDPNDVLECGIEIMVRPPGKELQTMTLLSGGEKTLTAIALLLAVFKTRPSPFSLLDEVDAALDEANNLRFNHVVQEFVRDTQFIIITHSKRTMSIADTLYGVTMQEAGVSKRVSVKFESPAESQSAVA